MHLMFATLWSIQRSCVRRNSWLLYLKLWKIYLRTRFLRHIRSYLCMPVGLALWLSWCLHCRALMLLRRALFVRMPQNALLKLRLNFMKISDRRLPTNPPVAPEPTFEHLNESQLFSLSVKFPRSRTLSECTVYWVEKFRSHPFYHILWFDRHLKTRKICCQKVSNASAALGQVTERFGLLYVKL